MDDIKELAMDNIMVVGYRGSSVVGLQHAGSDVDRLIVLDTESTDHTMLLVDDVVLSRNQFKKIAYRVGFEAVETIYNVAEGNVDYLNEISKFRNLIENDGKEHADWLFWFEVWLMLRNQIKLYRKYGGTKFVAKVLLYTTLLEDSELIRFWQKKARIDSDLVNDYHRVRSGNVRASDLERFEKIVVWRNDFNNRDRNRQKFNTVHREFDEIIKGNNILF